jgi:3-hydroxyisobutyrate dehydrogenase-like beta-hydroxyacid dehydrogenase
MALRLMAAGYNVVVHDLRPEVMETLVQQGALASASPRQSVQGVTMTVLPSPREVEEVYFGGDGLLAGLTGAGEIVIEASGIDPQTTLRLESAVKDRGARFLACTLHASGAPAVTIPDGLLGILVGGERSTAEECLDIFQSLAQTVICVPEVGTPKLLKIAVIMEAVAHSVIATEVALWLHQCGVDPEWLIRVREETETLTPARQLKLVMAGGRGGQGGNVRNTHKDLTLALQLASEKDLPLPLTSCAHQVLQQVKGAGLAGQDLTAALMALHKRVLGEVPTTSRPLDLSEHLPVAHAPEVHWLGWP